MKKPWHNRKNTRRGGRHRRSRHSTNLVTFQEPTTTTHAKSAFAASKSRFRANGKPGTRPEAVIIDMDGTLENWDGHPNPPGLEYARKHHAEGRVLIILTARDHEWSYQRTHDWLVKHLDIPFVGPICRPADDERYACDFKKHVHDQLSVMYEIVSAIDDDHYVLSMWRSIPGLEVVETSYNYNSAKGVRSGGWSDYFSTETAGQSSSVKIDLDAYEPDDEEAAWLAEYEKEIQEIKRRQPKRQPEWMQRWEEDGLDVYCNHCDHPWFDHDITGCTSTAACQCAG